MLWRLWVTCSARSINYMYVHTGQALDEIPPLTEVRGFLPETVLKFTLEPGTRANLIRGYSATEIRIGEHSLQRSCIVTADRLITDWEPESFADLAPAHLEAILALTPEVVLLGTGATQRFAPPAVRALLAQRGVGLEAMQLGAACRTFNVLVQEGRRVAAALFLR
jgi:uncharacterized protein